MTHEVVDDARTANFGSISCPTRGEQETGSDMADQSRIIRQEWLDGNVAELAGKPDRNDADSAGMAHKLGIDARGRPVLPD